MFKAIYRLGEYRITEYENGLFQWETNIHFGVQRSGRCFILGNILIIGHWNREEIGYLKLEFFEQLQKLPAWNKTRYYCFASELLDVATGQSLTNDFLEKSLIGINSTALKSVLTLNPGMFRLGIYQITVTDNDEVLWQTYEGLFRIVGGRCVIESDVLFIGSKEYDEEDQNRRGFLNKLNQLPKWDKTMAWCRSMVLRDCLHQQQEEKTAASTQSYDKREVHVFDEKAATTFSTRLEEKPKRLSLSCFKCKERVWDRILGLKGWLKYLIPLLVVGFLLGLIMILYSIERESHESHWKEEHHHKHDDH